MKKNSQEKVLQEPKKGELYKIWKDQGLTSFNIMKIIRVEGNIAYYTLFNESSIYEQRWDFVKFPDCLGQKITSLEKELM